MDLHVVFRTRALVMKSVPFFLKGAFRAALICALREVLDGNNQGHELHTQRGWKMLMLLPRMLLARPRGGKVSKKKLPPEREKRHEKIPRERERKKERTWGRERKKKAPSAEARNFWPSRLRRRRFRQRGVRRRGPGAGVPGRGCGGGKEKQIKNSNIFKNK